jgi:hypothetical protein
MPGPSVSRSRSVVAWTALGLAVIIAAAAIVFDVARRAGGMQAATTSAAKVLSARPGARINAVVRLLANEQNNIWPARLLESAGATTYRETPDRIRIALGADTGVVMGSGADIRTGAVVQASGAMDDTHLLHATRIVILTGYVRVVAR